MNKIFGLVIFAAMLAVLVIVKFWASGISLEQFVSEFKKTKLISRVVGILLLLLIIIGLLFTFLKAWDGY
jgi:uncharacterized membrane protein